MTADFWRGRRVFLTGHTGFKGSWLCLWLRALGAEVTGFELAGVAGEIRSIIADIRDRERLASELAAARPEVVFHLAAQPIVLASYKEPVETYAVNVMGTVHLLDAVRRAGGVHAVVNVTTDKVYENREWWWGYREVERLGGRDPYSNSKACSELVTASFRDSFFEPAAWDRHGTAVATARAGNIVGGGDWAVDRLVPDCVRALLAGRPVGVRNPGAVRPWQHVLDPLRGYLLLARALVEQGPPFVGGWNFGPPPEDSRPVEDLVRILCSGWGDGASYEVRREGQPHEAHHLRLDSSRARHLLDWRTVWDLEASVARVVEWHREARDGADPADLCRRQITEYESALSGEGTTA
jgi:CDP-glucose 4,6-dehydratase